MPLTEEKQIKQKLQQFITPQNVIVLLCVGAFLPFIFSAIIDVIAILLIVCTPQFQRGLLNFRGAFIIPVFCVYAFAVAFLNKNKLGLLIAPLFFGILLLYCFVRQNIQKETIETCYTAVCFMVFPAFVWAIIEVLTASGGKYVYRCSAYFANANYFGALMAAVLIIAAHKVISKMGRSPIYYVVGFVALINIYLSGSLFAIIEAIVGVSVYLLVKKHYRLFCLLLILGSLSLIIITGIPELLPRLSETSTTTGYRVRIWGVILKDLGTAIWFGRGFMSYNIAHTNYEGSYSTVHGHNLVLDSLLNFGIIGTVIVFLLIFVLLKTVIRVYSLDQKSDYAAIALAIAAAIAAHSFTDITFFWIQTGVFYVIVLGSIGLEERRLEINKNPLIFGRYRI